MSHDKRIPPEQFRWYVVYFVIFNNSPNTANGKIKMHSIMNIFVIPPLVLLVQAY